MYARTKRIKFKFYLSILNLIKLGFLIIIRDMTVMLTIAIAYCSIKILRNFNGSPTFLPTLCN